MHLDMTFRRTVHVVGTEDSFNHTTLGTVCHIVHVNQHVAAHIGSNTRIITFSSLTTGTAVGIVSDGSACQSHLRITTHVGHITAAVKIITDSTTLHLDFRVMLDRAGLTTTEDITENVGGITTDSDICIDGSRERIAQIKVTTATAIHIAAIASSNARGITDSTAGDNHLVERLIALTS